MAFVELGDFRITHVQAGVYHWDGGAYFGVVPKTLWSRHVQPDQWNRVPLALNCYIVQAGDRTVLIETGGGNKMDDRARERMQVAGAALIPLPDLISAAGIDPESIDTVLNTHLHWDHVGWNTVFRNGVAIPAFPRATYFTRHSEWEHAHERHPRDAVSYIDANYDPLVESGRMRLIGEDREIVPGIRMEQVRGHNRDMCVVTASSGGRTFCFFSDLVPSVAHLTPTWVPAFDLFPLESIDNKTKWLTRAARDNWICGLGHEVAMAFVTVGEKDGRFHVTHRNG